MTGMRSWIGAIDSPAGQVRIVQARPLGVRFQTPAKPKGMPPGIRM